MIIIAIITSRFHLPFAFDKHIGTGFWRQLNDFSGLNLNLSSSSTPRNSWSNPNSFSVSDINEPPSTKWNWSIFGNSWKKGTSCWKYWPKNSTSWIIFADLRGSPFGSKIGAYNWFIFTGSKSGWFRIKSITIASPSEINFVHDKIFNIWLLILGLITFGGGYISPFSTKIFGGLLRMMDNIWKKAFYWIANKNQ